MYSYGNILSSIYFTHDKVADFPISGHIYTVGTLETIPVTIARQK